MFLTTARAHPTKSLLAHAVSITSVTVTLSNTTRAEFSKLNSTLVATSARMDHQIAALQFQLLVEKNATANKTQIDGGTDNLALTL